MAVKIGTLDETLEDQGLKCLVFGDPKAGKTVLAGTTQVQTMIINAEGGLLSLQDLDESVKDLITVATISSIDDLQQVFVMLDQDNPFEWVVLDSVSEIAEVCLGEEKGKSADGRAAYGALADIIYKELRKFRNLPNTNVMMTCKMQLVEVAPGVNRFGPLMPGKQLTQGISYLFDEVFAIRIFEDDDGNLYRALQTGGDMKFACGDRSGKLEMLEPPDLHHILNKSGLGRFTHNKEAKEEAETVEEASEEEPEEIEGIN